VAAGVLVGNIVMLGKWDIFIQIEVSVHHTLQKEDKLSVSAT